MQWRSEFRREIPCIDDVLDADGNSVQWTLGSAPLPFGVAGAGLFESIVRVQVRPGPNLAIDPVDPL